MTSDLEGRFVQLSRRSAWADDSGPIIVGISGGMDSMTLLYLLRFSLRIEPETLHAAHVDHRMRPSSPADATWLRGVCLAWGLHLHTHVSDPPVESEAEGRKTRYSFFADLAARVGAARP